MFLPGQSQDLHLKLSSSLEPLLLSLEQANFVPLERSGKVECSYSCTQSVSCGFGDSFLFPSMYSSSFLCTIHWIGLVLHSSQQCVCTSRKKRVLCATVLELGNSAAAPSPVIFERRQIERKKMRSGSWRKRFKRHLVCRRWRITSRHSMTAHSSGSELR